MNTSHAASHAQLGDDSSSNTVAISYSYMATQYAVPDDPDQVDETNPVPPVSSTQGFRADLQMFHPGGSPAGNFQVYLYLDATEVPDWQNGVTMKINGTDYTLVPDINSAVAITTSVAGGITIEYDPGSSATAPTVLLYDTDTQQDLEIVLDTGNRTTFINLSAEELDPSVATDYQGNAILTASFSGQASRTALASALNSMALTTTGGSSAQTLARKRMRPVRRNHAGAGSRPSGQPKDDATFTLTLDETAGASWSPGGEVAVVTDGLGDDFKDFWHAIYKEAGKIGTVIWNAAVASVTAVVDGVTKTFNLAVSKTEQAFHLVLGVMQSVVNDVEQIYEWLSQIFDWKDICNTAKLIEGQVQNGLVQFGNALTSALNKAEGEVDTLTAKAVSVLGTLNTQVSSALDPSSGVYSQLQPDLASQQSDSQASLSASSPELDNGLASNKSQAQWATGQLKSSTSALALTVGDSSDAYSQLAQDLKSQYEDMVGQIDVDGLKTALGKVISDIGDLLKPDPTSDPDPTSLAQIEFTKILATFDDFLIFIADLADAAIDAIFDILKMVVTIVFGGTDSTGAPVPGIANLKISGIPLLPGIFKAITKQELTLLNLACMLISCLFTPIYKILNSGEVPSSTDSLRDGYTFPAWMDLVKICKDMIEAAANLLKDTLDQADITGTTGKVITGLLSGLAVAGFISGFQSEIANPTTENLLFACMGIIPLLVDFASYLLHLAGAEEASNFDTYAVPIIKSGYGVAFIAAAVAYAIFDKDDGLGTDGTALIGNLVGNIPDLLSALPPALEAVEVPASITELIMPIVDTTCPVLVAVDEAVAYGLDH